MAISDLMKSASADEEMTEPSKDKAKEAGNYSEAEMSAVSRFAEAVKSGDMEAVKKRWKVLRGFFPGEAEA